MEQQHDYLQRNLLSHFFRIVTQCCGFYFRRRSFPEAFWSDAAVWCSKRRIPLCCLQDSTARWQLATTNRRAGKYQHHVDRGHVCLSSHSRHYTLHITHHAILAKVVWYKERCVTIRAVGLDHSSYRQSVNLLMNRWFDVRLLFMSWLSLLGR